MLFYFTAILHYLQRGLISFLYCKVRHCSSGDGIRICITKNHLVVLVLIVKFLNSRNCQKF